MSLSTQHLWGCILMLINHQLKKSAGGYKYVMDVYNNPLKTKLLNDADKRDAIFFRAWI